jgi:hypothetical protein
VSEVGLIYRNIGLKSEFGSHRSTDMDVQEMLERLLADKEETKADMRQMMAEMGAMMDAHQARMEAITRAGREERRAESKAWREKIEARTKATQAETDAIWARTTTLRDERTEANSKACPTETNPEIPEEGAAEARLECEEQCPKEVEANFITCRTEAIVCQKEMKVASQEDKEPMSKEVDSEAERREVPKEEVAVESSRVMKKRPRGRRIAAGRCVKPTKLIRGDGESRKKLVAACRKVSCRASSSMAEEKPCQGYSDPGKLWTAAGIGFRWNEEELLDRRRTAQGTRDLEATKE